jgi:hypothetical protein
MSQPPTPEESRVSELIREIDVRAPAALHERVQTLVAERSRTPGASPRRRIALAGALAVVLAAVIAVAVAGLGGGGGAKGPGPLVSAASQLTRLAATAPAPAENPARRGELLADVEGVAFPYWEEHLGWRATGARTDTVAGRPARTVFYTDAHGRRVGYAIVGGPSVQVAGGGSTRWRRGTPYKLISLGGVPAVVWLRNGRLCVVSGRGMSEETLLRLASWEAQGALNA